MRTIENNIKSFEFCKNCLIKAVISLYLILPALLTYLALKDRIFKPLYLK